MRIWGKRKTRVPGLPSDGELIAYLDGQLPPERRREVRGLLENSWELRSRLADIERDTKCYVDACADEFAALLPSPTDTWAAIRAKQGELSRHAPPAGTVGLRELPPVTVVRHPAWRWAASLGAAAVLAGIVFFFSIRPEALSAAAILERGHAIESSALRTQASPVLHQTLVARKGRQSASWQIWRAPTRARYAERVDGTQATVRELKSVLEENHMDPQRPLSAGAYREWREHVPIQREQVTDAETQGGDKAYRIETTVARAGGVRAILSSRLLMRRSDWHPVAQQLTVRTPDGDEQFEISETASEVVAFEALSASVFAEAAPAIVAGTARPSIAQLPSPPLPEIPLPTRAQIVSAEVKALYALHRMQACSGEQIDVEASAKGVRVHGLVETKARKRELAAGLAGLEERLLSVDLHAAEEHASAEEPLVPEGLQPALASNNAPAPGDRLAVEGLIPRRPDGNGTLVALSNETVLAGRSLLMEAWAIRRLFDRYAEISGAVEPGDRWLLEAIARDHLVVFEQSRRRIAEILQSLVPSLAPAAAAKSNGPGLRETDASRAARELVDQARRANSVLLALFARGTNDSPGRESLTTLATGLAQMESDSKRLRMLLDRLPVGRPDWQRAKTAESR
jgi:hypothetical protein